MAQKYSQQGQPLLNQMAQQRNMLQRYTHEQLAEWLKTHIISGGAQGGLIGDDLKIGFSLTSPLSYKRLEQVLDVTIPILTSTKVDTTVHGINRFERSIGGMQTVGDCVIKLLRDPYSATSPNQNLLFAQLAAQTQLYWKVEIPADSNLATTLFWGYEFQGRVMNIAPTAPLKDRQEYVVTVGFDSTFFNEIAPVAGVL